LLPPVKSAFGWHVIQFLDRRKQPMDRMKDIEAQAAAPGADFAAIAKANSEDPSKDKGGDIGWIAKYQLTSIKEIAIFKAPLYGLTSVLQDTDGIYLFQITAEETRKADGEQADLIRNNAFTNWYTAQKSESRITRDFSTSDSTTPVAQ
jgi:parvulin-like peptidyl-prolyl isomerase